PRRPSRASCARRPAAAPRCTSPAPPRPCAACCWPMARGRGSASTRDSSGAWPPPAPTPRRPPPPEPRLALAFAGPRRQLPRPMTRAFARFTPPDDLLELLRLAWPVVMARLGIMTMGLIDAVVVGRYSAQEL